jgi:phage terminase small subunit
MKAAQWRKKIVKAMTDVGTYNKSFDQAVDTLAYILEKRDDAQVHYDETGSRPIVIHTNKGGADNEDVNPALKLIMNLNSQALTIWRDLGLTPAGLKKINDEAMKERKVSSLDSVLSGLEK